MRNKRSPLADGDDVADPLAGGVVLMSGSGENNMLHAAAVPSQGGSKTFGTTQTSVFAPYSEWRVDDPTIDGNPFDVEATVTFTNAASGETIRTGMFYTGSDYAFRFTATEAGDWTFSSDSEDADLDGLTGTVSVAADDDAKGFVVASGNKFAQQNGDGSLTALLPNYVMIDPDLSEYAEDPGKIDELIDTYLVEHGFTGFHIPNIGGQFFDIDNENGDSGSAIGRNKTNPDPESFAALEQIITATHAAGGHVHFWPWGDSNRGQTPEELPGGENGEVHQRFLEYLADRLAPIPGWTMGYGFDNDEWTSPQDAAQRTAFFEAQTDYAHLLAVRSEGPNRGLDHREDAAWWGGQGFADYEHHEPEYATYVAALEASDGLPVMSGDRFRIRGEDGPGKDYTAEQTVDGLWESTMAGGVANIWGNLTRPDGSQSPTGNFGSFPYPEETATQIATWNEFMLGQDRFALDMARANDLTGGPADGQYALLSNVTDSLIVYAEDTSTVRLNLSSFASDPGWGASAEVVAVDTEEAYAEISLGTVSLSDQTIDLGRASDWALHLRPSDAPAPPPPDGGSDGETDGGTDAGGGTDGGSDGGSGSGGGSDQGSGGSSGGGAAPFQALFEAENLELANYSVEEERDASGDAVVRLASKSIGVAEASLEFEGATGTYDVEIGFIDERDGQGSISLMVGDATVDSWTLDEDDDALNTVMVEDVEIARGETVTLVGQSEDGERARIDHIKVVSADAAPGDPAPDGQGDGAPPAGGDAPQQDYRVRFEAEDLSLENYAADRIGGASGGDVARLVSKSIGTASASTTFSGPDGLYDLELGWFDERDGQGDVFIFVNGREVGAWALDADNDALASGFVEDVVLAAGDELEIVGMSDEGERARVDFLEVVTADAGDGFLA